VAEKTIKDLVGIQLIPRQKFSSELGSFSVTYESEVTARNLFYQDSVAILENRNTLKGMHFQSGKYAQAKLVTVLQGGLIDYFVDLRKSSSTYLDYGFTILDDQNNNMLFLPVGFAHGYITIEQKTIVSYKLGSPYSPENEITLLWNDPTINIKWPAPNQFHISKKDLAGLTLPEIEKHL
jgi:dTDP-4-dehydrorhamnose 3,5-epimerase